jgi:hypothetical protein
MNVSPRLRVVARPQPVDPSGRSHVHSRGEPGWPSAEMVSSSSRREPTRSCCSRPSSAHSGSLTRSTSPSNPTIAMPKGVSSGSAMVRA